MQDIEGYTYGVHLEVDELPSGQSDHHLPLVDGALHNDLLPRSLPLVDSLIGTDVTDSIGIDLEQQGGHCRTRVPHYPTAK